MTREPDIVRKEGASESDDEDTHKRKKCQARVQ